MRAITVKQPWAWAIARAGKNVENRSRNIAGAYRGPVAIHAGKGHTDAGLTDPRLRDAINSGWLYAATTITGAFIAVAELVDAHPHVYDADSDQVCCQPWGDPAVWHLVLADVRPLPEPIPARGRLGLWTPSSDLLQALLPAHTTPAGLPRRVPGRALDHLDDRHTWQEPNHD